MRVFKFGGASVKDAAGVKNIGKILSEFTGEKIVVVVSAMGKTTNALEKVVNDFFYNPSTVQDSLKAVKEFHYSVIQNLELKNQQALLDQVNTSFTEIEWVLEDGHKKDYGLVYDQIVSHGELISTRIVHAYLTESGQGAVFLDIRDCLITDNTYREGKVNWELTERLVRMKVPGLFESSGIVITQGFIGSTSENFNVTLGREGSDYTAAILSFCLDAEEMCVWKDVPGILSADPKYSDEAVKLQEISYLDAIELTYYGATVIHPKTIKPLENKNIPLRVRSFISPQEKGTLVGNFSATKPLVPCYIFKENQILISISAKDFSFIAEDNLSVIFGLFAKHKVKVNLTQNSAVSFSACADNDPFKIPGLIEALQDSFKVLYNDQLKLVTIRHYYASTLEAISRNKTILLEQRSRHTAQLVLRDAN